MRPKVLKSSGLFFFNKNYFIINLMPKIIQQRTKCIGCTACAGVCPEFFEMSGKDGLANLKKSKKVGDDFELEIDKAGCIKEAADVCPVQIIKIEN